MDKFIDVSADKKFIIAKATVEKSRLLGGLFKDAPCQIKVRS